MSAFITQCPNCETTFNITQAQLKLAEGKVRCGFCLRTFSALEQQLFIEEELQSNEEIFNGIDNDSEQEREIPADRSDNIEEPASEQSLKTLSEENNEHIIKEESDDSLGLPERDNEEDDALETLLLEHKQTDSEFTEASEEIIEELAQLDEDYSTEDTHEDEKQTMGNEALEEAVEERVEDTEEDINAEDGVEGSTSEDMEVSMKPLLDEVADETEIKKAANKDKDGDGDEQNEPASVEDYEDLYGDLEESGLREDLSKERELLQNLEENIEEDLEDIEEEIEVVEKTEVTIKEQVQEIDSSSIAISSSGGIKRKEELQSLETLYDDEALNKDGSIPVNSISEEPIPIYRQYSRPASITLLLFFCNLLLIIVLGAQYAWANFDTYLRESRFIGLTGFVCNYANCPDVRRFDLSLFSTDELIINTHPSTPNALQIDFIFRNTAEFEQAFPLVELNFSDLNRRLVANRLFKPEEYLDEDLKQFTHLPPNSSVQIRLEIADPGAEAINYSLTLRTP